MQQAVEATKIGLRSPFSDTRLIIHWKGEPEKSYTINLRHAEFLGALLAVTSDAGKRVSGLSFVDALQWDGLEPLRPPEDVLYNSAMQFVEWHNDAFSIDSFYEAAERCSLVHAIYEVVGVADSYSEAAMIGMENGKFQDMYKGGTNENATWCFRARYYICEHEGKPLHPRHGDRARSLKRERESLSEMRSLFLLFGGRVDLNNPDCTAYMFDGLVSNGKKCKVLARERATGARPFPIAPNTRICVTTTPLTPVAAFALCNVAAVKDGDNVLDPFSGSCTTLLASAMLARSSTTVGIELAEDWMVNRTNVLKDFETRDLKQPAALIHGDCMNETVRDQARDAIVDKAFDAIVTDPPYGIRESKDQRDPPPLTSLFRVMAIDRDRGKRLLKVGGRLVAFVPVEEDQHVENCIPPEQEAEFAGLRMELMKEQQLNDRLSRWLVSYECIK